MVSKNDYVELIAVLQSSLQRLLKCKTRQETIQALEEVSNLLISEGLPIGAVAAEGLKYARTADDASVMKVRDDIVERLRVWLSQAESGLSELETGASTASKPRRVWIFIALGLAIVCICAVIALALAAALMAMGGA
jgi:hypothetical protein